MPASKVIILHSKKSFKGEIFYKLRKDNAKLKTKLSTVTNSDIYKGTEDYKIIKKDKPVGEAPAVETPITLATTDTALNLLEAQTLGNDAQYDLIDNYDRTHLPVLAKLFKFTHNTKMTPGKSNRRRFTLDRIIESKSLCDLFGHAKKHPEDIYKGGVSGKQRVFDITKIKLTKQEINDYNEDQRFIISLKDLIEDRRGELKVDIPIC